MSEEHALGKSHPAVAELSPGAMLDLDKTKSDRAPARQQQRDQQALANLEHVSGQSANHESIRNVCKDNLATNTNHTTLFGTPTPLLGSIESETRSFFFREASATTADHLSAFLAWYQNCPQVQAWLTLTMAPVLGFA